MILIAVALWDIKFEKIKSKSFVYFTIANSANTYSWIKSKKI